MTWLAIAGIFIVIVVALLLFPVNFHAESYRSSGTMYGRFSISWLILRIRYSIADKRTDVLILSRRIISKQQTAKQPEEKIIEKIGPAGRSLPGINDFTSLAGPMLHLFRSLAQTLRFRFFEFDTTYGLGDPALTGMLTGYLHALQGSFKRNFSFTPDFNRTVLDWDVKVSITITPLWIFPPVVRFAANPQVLRTGWRMIRS